jgi:aryl-alcohol dehydrogenase-like predicted oxidoreductase
MHLPKDLAALSRLSLGTVQFGLPYGVANTGGQVDEATAQMILRMAQDNGVYALDTASAYGASESVIGSFGSQTWRITTKLAALPVDCDDVTTWAKSEIRGSLKRLRTTAVDTVLLHHPDDLLGTHGDELHKALMNCREQGLFRSHGVSLYRAGDLERFVGRFDIDAVQLPFNILDREFVTGGYARALRKAGIEVQVRSIFLQGLLLLSLDEQIRRFPAGETTWRRFADWTAEEEISPFEACVRFAMGQADIDAIIVGVDSVEHLTTLLVTAEKPPIDVPLDIVSVNTDVIDPRRWQ